ncbi:signal peptidase II [Candidatus Kirkpatrickella diaphorinae]|uniref:Lipoprotein signal peptidase n=1 Tax=Candidatus Kirkpatrickella diaphorinae TaxID=2984322 RepID=A0ABY6GIJ5_9PROT|nr:signal peptidase II [Candidatus Kirkpatrickella diaphorinae]UYH51144.1 signal peptidase II [Candidatus Kirkpatrickella diaphorinae]
MSGLSPTQQNATTQRHIPGGAVAGLIILLADQVSKYWILYIYDLPAKISVPVLSWFNLTMVWNRAVTFGMLGGLGKWAPWIFSSLALLAVAVLIYVMMTTPRRFVAIASGMIAGGAIGNVLDRLRLGAVVDFIHLHAAGWNWFVFNIADMAIDVGVALWILDRLILDRQARCDA